MSRIVAGSAKGRRIRTPKGRVCRPTSERVREALFSSLESTLGSLRDVRFLELYAGSGAVSLEAISRGAKLATLVEAHPGTAALARRNVTDLGFAGVQVVTGKAERVVASRAPHAFDAAFLDPPYDLPNPTVTSVLTDLTEYGWLAVGAIVAVERSTRTPGLSWPARIEAERSRKYGETTLWYGRATDGT